MAIFRADKTGQVIGGKVKSGIIELGSHIRLMRGGLDLTRMKVIELQAGKENVKDVEKGTECGMKLDGKIEVRIGDTLEVYREQRVEKKVK